jgi:hypothetical protein
VKQEICLKESETYRVFFWMGEEPATGAAWFKQKGQFLKHWAQYFTFVPGTYPITVEAKYWDNDDFTGSDYHTAFETKTVEYSAPQSIILVGAVLGGFIFTFLSIVRAEQNAMSGAPAGWLNIDKGKKLLTFVGSALLSAIITILLSRIGETQFFIKVSVSDFWGAIATGFLANYGGWALLDKMIPVKNKGGEEKK